MGLKEPIVESLPRLPGAFIGSVGELMAAIMDDREPTISGAEKLKTLQIFFAAYQYEELGRAIAPFEITAGNLLEPRT